METEVKKKDVPKILIVDDISINVKILENIVLEEGYEALCAQSVQEALDIMNHTLPQLILSDYSMPGMNGLDFCKLLKNNPKTRDIPFVFITVADSGEDKKAAFLAGAVDFIPKPFEPVEVIMRMNNQLNSYRIKQEMEDYNRMMHRMVAEQKKQMEKERENVLLALAKVAERKNARVKNHLERVGYNSRILAQSLQLVPAYERLITDGFVEAIETAAKLHDVGNIFMSDSDFIKENGETKDRREVIRLRSEEGAKILEEIREESSDSGFMDMAIRIARYHHADWDGTGYPEGVGGKDIPLEARIVAIVNDFDNLVGEKEGRSVEECVGLIGEKSGAKYDPDIVKVFDKVIKQFRLK